VKNILIALEKSANDTLFDNASVEPTDDEANGEGEEEWEGERSEESEEDEGRDVEQLVKGIKRTSLLCVNR
jgi:hypothetical protein